jgi:hypothetical protein
METGVFGHCGFRVQETYSPALVIGQTPQLTDLVSRPLGWLNKSPHLIRLADIILGG